MKNSKTLWLIVGLCILFPCFHGCDSHEAADATTEPLSPLAADTWFPLRLGTQEIRVQLAIAEDERQQGLMQRDSLGNNDGMLFLFEQPKQQSFWMENTPLPLSIGYFNPQGVLQEVYSMEPYDRTAVRSKSTHIQYALEMKQGWFRVHGVRAGARLDVEALRNAVLARGYEPARYGL